MKILHIITSLEIGGAQRLLADLLPLQKQKNEVKLLVFKNEGSAFQKKIIENGIEIVCLRCTNLKNPVNVKRLIPYLQDCEIAHVHLFPTFYWVALAARTCKNVKLVFTEHSTHNKRRNKHYFRPIEQYIYHKYDRIISISQQTQDNLKTWLRIDENDKRFVVVENGVNLNAFSNVASTSSNIKQIIMVSRFAQMKDQETLIRSMAKVDKEAELVLVGDGPNKQYCEKVAKELGLEDRIKFLGARSDIPQLVAKAYIGVQSSKWEGFGLTAVEMMAAHKPIIVSDVDGLKQVVNGAGLLFKVGDADSLANLLNDLLKDKMFYQSIADKCLERAQKYDIQLMVDRYNEVYESVLYTK